MITGSVWPERTSALIAEAGTTVAREHPKTSVEEIERLVAAHDSWRLETLNLLGADGVMSPRSRAVLASDLASRVAEGLPADRDTSTSPAVASEFSDQIESRLVALLQALFRARFVEWRPVSTTMAMGIALRALCDAGDVIAVQSMSAGANISYHKPGVAGILGLRTVDLPGNRFFEIDMETAPAIIRKSRPRCIVVGGTKVLFRYPIRELRDVADDVGAVLIFDGAHLGPFIHAGLFNDPLAEGAHILITGTHKIMGGPVGGVLLSDSAEIADAIARAVWPAFMQTRDQNKFAAAAIAMAEMLCFGQAFAADVQANARTLGASLDGEGLDVIGAERGYSDTHQVIVSLEEHATKLARNCSEQGVLLAQTNIFGERRSDVAASGVRMSVAQITRRGMGPKEMPAVAKLVARAGRAENVKQQVTDLARQFSSTKYCF